MKYINIVIFAILTFLYLCFSSHINFSTNFIEIFFSQKSLKLFDVAKKFGISNEILISKKGFDKKSLDELQNIAGEVRKIPEISKVKVSFALSNSMKKYLRKNFYLLADFNNTKITNNDIEKKLQKIKENIYNSFIYKPVNSYDPLGLFKVDFKSGSKFLKLKNYGYIIKATTTVDTSDAAKARVVYDKIKLTLKKYPGTIAYAPFFFLIENSAHIRGDAQIIMLISTILLLMLYFVILKNHKLFLNAILAIFSSIISAILLTSLIFKTISILALVFGISITTISIDYMFHYYFHGDFSRKKFILQKRVFFGFLTTVGVFIIFSFINIDLFAQLAIFSVISLSVAYALFTWVFVYLRISAPSIKKSKRKLKSFNPLHVVILSLVLFGFAYHNLHFDNNLKNLDYQNDKLLKLSKKFNSNSKKGKYKSIIIEAKTKELLLEKYEKILQIYPSMLGIGKFVFSDKKCKQKLDKLKKYDFDKVKDYIDIYSKKIGFNNVFKNAYRGVDKLKCNMKVLDGMHFKIIKDADNYYTLALINKDLIKPDNLFEIVDLAKSLSSDTRGMKVTLEKYMLISIAFIFAVLFFSYGLEMFYPAIYLLFPVSVVLFSISILGKINIMHIFALVILIAISIDYGIYMYKTPTLDETKMAIKYALLSTFFGFGILIFSSTVALYSIGFVITLGVASIFLLLYAGL